MATAIKSFRLSSSTSSHHLPKRLLGSSSSRGESDENLHYTLDHPRPLAVCSLGAKRIGGIYVSDRSQLLTRKVIRVAISANGLRVRNRPNTSSSAGGGGGGGNNLGVKYLQNCSTLKRAAAIQTLQPRTVQQQQQPNYHMVNYNLTNVAGAAKKLAVSAGGGVLPSGIQVQQPSSSVVVSSVVGGGGVVSLSSLAPGTSVVASSSGTIGVGAIPPNVSLVTAAGSRDASFKTDIQDFKGGIKFELGRKIKHILPLGAEVSK